MSYDKCPNCGKSVKGFLASVALPPTKVDFINKYTPQPKEGYCSTCAMPLFTKISEELRKQKDEIQKRLKQIIHFIPILTSPAPLKWEYDVVGMVATQITSGTGFITELSRSFNDFFGSGSNTTNQKVAKATNLCQSDLRVQCAKQGGNAIISTDIDFNEIGSGSTNMLMVCMAGTAIKVTDMSTFNVANKDEIAEAIQLTIQLDEINTEVETFERELNS